MAKKNVENEPDTEDIRAGVSVPNWKATLTVGISIFALLVAAGSLRVSKLSYYNSIKPKETKLTLETEIGACQTDLPCYDLFVYNNDEAPCFEFTIRYTKGLFNYVTLLKGYEKSTIFNSEVKNNMIVFPAMQEIRLPMKSNDKEDSHWLGYLANKGVTHFRFYTDPKRFTPDSEVKVSCVGYEWGGRIFKYF